MSIDVNRHKFTGLGIYNTIDKPSTERNITKSVSKIKWQIGKRNSKSTIYSDNRLLIEIEQILLTCDCQ